VLLVSSVKTGVLAWYNTELLKKYSSIVKSNIKQELIGSIVTLPSKGCKRVWEIYFESITSATLCEQIHDLSNNYSCILEHEENT
jgi:hypothetical protein